MPSDILAGLLTWLVFPLWLIAGLADWTCHRLTRIESSSGTREANLHLLLIVEAALPIAVGLLFRINALTFAFFLLAFVLHEITVYADLKWSKSRREILPVEQMVHSLQEMLPFSALLLVAALNWPQVRALFLALPEADWSLQWRDPSFPLPWVVTPIALGFLLAVVPFAEEWLRCRRARQR